MTSTALVEHRFGFSNSGSEPLQLLSVRTSCGCSAAITSSAVLEAGERGSVFVQFTPEGRPGRKAVQAVLLTNDTHSSPTTFQLAANFQPEISHTSDRIDFGRVPAGESHVVQASVDILSGGYHRGFAIDEIGFVGIDSLQTWTETITEGHRYRIHLTNESPLSSGSHDGNLSISYRGRKWGVIQAAIHGYALGPVEVRPARILLEGTSNPDGRGRYALRVVAGTAESFRVTALETPDGVSATIEDMGEYYIISLTDIPTYCHGESQSIHVHTDIVGTETLDAPIFLSGCDTAAR